MCPANLSVRVPVVAMVGPYPAIQLMGRRPLPRRGISPFPRMAPAHAALSGITPHFCGLSPSGGCVAHALLTSPPL